MMTVEETGNLLHDENILSGDDFITMAIDESNHQQAWFICFCLAMVKHTAEDYEIVVLIL